MTASEMPTDNPSPAPTPDEKPPARDVRWMPHAKDNWYDRVADPELHLATDGGVMWDVAWDRAIPVDYPPAREPAAGYYHPEADLVLLARPDREVPGQTAIITAIALTDRPMTQQHYVRSQAERAESDTQ